MEWPQNATDIICDTATADGITNSTIKHQCSWAMKMRYFWIIDQVQNLTVWVCWALGLKNLANYYTKHHIVAHHIWVWPYYLHMPHLPSILPKAPTSWDLQGCVEPPNPSYLAKTPHSNKCHVEVTTSMWWHCSRGSLTGRSKIQLLWWEPKK